MPTLVQDARYGLRMLRKNLGFTSVAVLALAIGIAANTAIFSVVHATLLAPLPFPEPDELVMVWSRIRNNRNGVSAGDFVEWRRQSTAFQSLNAWTGRRSSGESAGPGHYARLAVDVGYEFAHGRSFVEDEGIPGRDQVMILANRYWRERFNGDPNVIGQTIRSMASPPRSSVFLPQVRPTGCRTSPGCRSPLHPRS